MFGGFQAASTGFGTTGAAPFGAQSSPFGGGMSTTFGQPQQAAPFGTPGNTGLFGASQGGLGLSSTPSFGIGTSSFGASPGTFGAQANKPPSTFAFGQPGSGFGQPAPFGAAPASPFGAASAASPFGGMSTPGFGASPASSGFGQTTGMFGGTGMGTGFGAAAPASPFGAPTLGGFGASSAGFGSTSASPFGTPQPAATPFGSMTTSAFGGFGGGMGQVTPAPAGTKAVPFQKIKDPDTTTASQGNTGPQYFVCITAMPQYGSKSFEELRYEDYAQGVKGNPQAGMGGMGGAFGTTSTGFGAGGFGTSTAAFGAAKPAGAFGASSASPFGTSMTGASPFGAASAASPFGTSMASPFGTPQSSPFGASSPSSPFGTTGGFGATTPFGTPGTSFTGVQAATPSPFGTTPSPFGTPGSQSAFSMGGATSPFGTAAPAFSSSAFGGSSLFGPQTAASPFGTGALGGASTPSPFGTTSSPFGTNAFAAKPLSQSPFGASSGGAFSFPSTFSTPGLGTSFQTGAAMFPGSFAPNTGLGAMGFGQQQQVAPAGIAQSPYGTMPELPAVKLPEPKVGITQRPVSSTNVISRVSPLLRAPSSGARFGVPIQRRPASAAPPESPASAGASVDRTVAAAVSSPALVLRDNPYRLVIKRPPPATESAMASASTPAKTSAGLVQRSREKETENGSGPSLTTRGKENGDHAANGLAERTPSRTTANGSTNGHANGNGHDLDALLPTLGALKDRDYYMVPSEQRLRDMVKQEGPDALARVSGFTVGREGVGEVRALEPVDVRGLRLDRIVELKHGEVAMYADLANGEVKPPVGSGLNVRSEITLSNCWKRDKESNEYIKEGPRAVKYEKVLRKVCADNNTTFISYHLDGGVWKFEVEHFSRYGLPEDWDDDEEMADGGEDLIEGEDVEGEGARRVRPRRVSGGRSGAVAPGRAMGSEGRGPHLLRDVLEDEDLDGLGEEEQDLELESPLFEPPLQHALALQLNMDPQQLYDLREALYPERLQEEPTRGQQMLSSSASRAQKRAAISTISLKSPQPTTLAAHSWLPTQRTPLQPAPESIVRSSAPALELVAAGDVGGAAGQLAGLGMMDCPGHCGQDAAIFMGRSFRVGWGPGGVLAHTVVSGGTVGTAGVASLASMSRSQHVSPLSPGVVLTKLPLAAGMGCTAAEQEGFDGRLRVRLEKLLEVHQQHSRPREGAGPLGGWSLRSDRKEQLAALLQHYKDASQQAAQGAGQASRCERLCQQHEGDTWELLQVLFEYIEGEDDVMLGDQEMVMPRAMLAAFQRRARLSALLQRRVAGSVEAQLEGCGSVAEAVLLLLSGHQLTAATALAAACGDTMLATLVAQIGGHGTLQADCRAALSVWRQAGIDSLVQRPRLDTYSALAGAMTDVQPHLHLDWRRAFGMYLWYYSPPSTPLNEVLLAYVQGFNSTLGIPTPLPPYLEETGSTKREPTDTHYELLRLAAAGQGRGVAAGQLLRLAGHSPSPLDASLLWHVASILTSIDMLPAATPPLQVYQLCMSMVALLEAVGLTTWAVYAAAQLPDHPAWPGLREGAMQELLSRHCASWREDKAAVEQLAELAGSRQPLEQAKALLDRYSRMPVAEVAHLIAAGQAAEAHAVLCGRAAGRLLSSEAGAPSNTRLSTLIARLAELRAAAAASSGQDPIPDWSSGAGLLQTYMEGLGGKPLGGEGHLDMARRLQTAHDWARRLPGDSRTSFMAVLALISRDLSRWLLLDGVTELTGQSAAAQQLCDTQAVALRPLGGDALMFGLQVAAAQLGGYA